MIKRDSTIGIHESIVTDFHEPGGEDVLKETPDKLHDLQGKGS